MTRNEVLSEACDKCLKELYTWVTPKISWDDFKEECRIYSEIYKEWDDWKMKNQTNHPEWKDKSITECIGPRPYEFYYLPKEIMKDICSSYVDAYKIDSQQELLDTIETLKNYCKEPIVDKWIERNGNEPGYRGYDHPDNLHSCLMNLITDSNLNLENNTGTDIVDLTNKLQDKFFEFLDMAGNFYNWSRDLNSFNMTVYLGPSPNSNKKTVIENWKKYRMQEIEIDEEQIKKEYYGDDELD